MHDATSGAAATTPVAGRAGYLLPEEQAKRQAQDKQYDRDMNSTGVKVYQQRQQEDAAAGPSLSVPEFDLRKAINGAPVRREVRRALEVAGLSRQGGGQIYAGVRDGLGGYRTIGDSCCTFYDTERGRYLFSFTEQPGYERYVNVAPGRSDTMIGKTYDLLDQLRRNGR